MVCCSEVVLRIGINRRNGEAKGGWVGEWKGRVPVLRFAQDANAAVNMVVMRMARRKNERTVLSGGWTELI
jgi:hypothetical protein